MSPNNQQSTVVRFLSLLFLCSLGIQVLAQTDTTIWSPQQVTGQQAEYERFYNTPFFEIYDALEITADSGSLTEILQSDKFVANDTRNGIQTGAYWARITVTSEQADTLLFGFNGYRNSWDTIDIYIFEKDSLLEQQHSGHAILPRQKNIQNFFNYLLLPLQAGQTKTVYFRLSEPSRYFFNRPIYLRYFPEPEQIELEAYSLQQAPRSFGQFNFFDHQVFAGSTQVFKDSTGKLQLADVQGTWPEQSYFTRQLVYDPGAVYWLRAKIAQGNFQEAEAWLWNNMQGWDSLRAYVQTFDDHFEIQEINKSRQLADRTIPLWLPLNSINPAVADTVTVYFRMVASDQPWLNEFIYRPFLAQVDKHSFLQGLPMRSYYIGMVQGLIALLWLIFLLIFFFTKDKSAFYFSVALLGLLLHDLHESLRKEDFTFFYHWYDSYWQEALLFLGSALLLNGLLKFLEKFLQLKKARKYFNILAIFFFLTAAGAYISQHVYYFGNVMQLFRITALTLFATIFISTIVATIQRRPFANYFLLGITPIMLAGLIGTAIAVFNLQPQISIFYYDIYRVGNLLTVLAFSLAMGLRLSALRNQEREAKRLQELDDFKNRLYTNITHEFRTPLTVIQGIAEEQVQNTEVQQLIQRNSQQLLGLVNQMLDLPKIDAGKLQLQPVQGDVVLFLKYVVESFHSLAFQKGINLTFYTELEDLWMDYDPQRLQQVLSNLITNALKFTPEYGKVLLVAKKTDQNQLQITVSDNGVGIPESELEHVFERFHQVGGREGGTGIGLALAKELVKLMNGSIAIESQVEKGTTFTILLPITTIAPKADIPKFAAAIVPLTSTEEIPQMTSEQPQLLIVEDNADVRTYLKNILAGHYQLAFAKNGKMGLEKAQENIPDIILSDVMMPELDGFELTKRLKTDERTSHIPVILLTARADTASKLEGLEYGADAYLIKPFDKQELFIRLRKLLELRQKLQARYQSLQPPTKATSKAVQQEDAFLQKLREVVENNISDEHFRIPEVCKAMGVSRTQLHRKLKALTGRSTSQVINSIRLQRAKHLLATTDWNVSQVAYEVGFQDHSYFSKLFQQEFGMLPSELK